MTSALPRVALPRLLGLVTLSFGFTLVTSTVDPALLGHKVLRLDPANSAGTYGLLTFGGLLVAALIQPLAGRLSDRLKLRTPFLFVGTLVILLGLVGIATAEALCTAFAGLILLQIGLNTAQPVWQSIIPLHIPGPQRGLASGIKALYDLLGAIIGRVVAGAIMSQVPTMGQNAVLLTILVPAIGLTGMLLVTLVSANGMRNNARGAPSPESDYSSLVSITEFQAQPTTRTFPPGFGRWFVNRFLFWCAFIACTTFLLFATIDVLGLSEADAQATNGQLTGLIGGALLLIILPAGSLADRLGRKPVIIAGGVLAALGTFGLANTRDLNVIVVFGVLIGLGVGLYLSGSLALLADIVPSDRSAQYLGIANIATALGSAIARLLGGQLITLVNLESGTKSNGYIALYIMSALFFALSALVMATKSGKSVTHMR